MAQSALFIKKILILKALLHNQLLKFIMKIALNILIYFMKSALKANIRI